MKISTNLCRRAIGPLVLTLAFLAAPAARPDPLSVSISVTSGPSDVNGGYHNFNQSGNTSVSDTHSFTGGFPTETYTIGSQFAASSGELHASVSTACTGASCYGALAYGLASFTDQLTINPASADLIGQAVDFTSILGLSGSLTASGGSYFNAEDNQFHSDANSSWQVKASVNGAQVLTRQGTDDSLHGVQGDPIGKQTVDAQVALGIPFALTITLHVDSSLYYGEGVAAADLGHTLTWGGITGVTLADTGAPVDFTVSSASGFDYQSSHIPADSPTVPESSGAVLLGAGLLGLSLLAKHKKHLASHLAPPHLG